MQRCKYFFYIILFYILYAENASRIHQVPNTEMGKYQLAGGLKLSYKSNSNRQYTKDIYTSLRDIPVPEIGSNEVLIQVKAAAVNPLELLILTAV